MLEMYKCTELWICYSINLLTNMYHGWFEDKCAKVWIKEYNSNSSMDEIE